MIPIRLSLAGFLSYRQPTEIDFTPITLACISGDNGAGKSSLLDAITWVLFGQARKRDDAIINAFEKRALVELEFFYEGNIYRVQRLKERDKSVVLEFHILQSPRIEGFDAESLKQIPRQEYLWKPLTESTVRETEARIRQTLRLDYDTFVNASFFLQGKADQFTQQRPTDRKRILSSILGLDIWEEYRQRAAELRKQIEVEIGRMEGHLQEIRNELAEESERRARLREVEDNLARVEHLLKAKESLLESARREQEALALRAQNVAMLEEQWNKALANQEELGSLLAERLREREQLINVIRHAEEIRHGYTAWQQAKTQLEAWEQVAQQFRQQDALRQQPLQAIHLEKVRLEQEAETLRERERAIEQIRGEVDRLQKEIAQLEQRSIEISANLDRKSNLEVELREVLETSAHLKAMNERLRQEMHELEERIQQLSRIEGAECPLCGQPLDPEERQTLQERLREQGRAMGNRYRQNKYELTQSSHKAQEIQQEITRLSALEMDGKALEKELAEHLARYEHARNQIQAWQQLEQPRLKELEEVLAEERYAPEPREELRRVEALLKEIGYDANAHERTRRAEIEGRVFEAQYLELEKAQATLKAIEREIEALQQRLKQGEQDVRSLEGAYREAKEDLEQARAQATDVQVAEQEYYRVKEETNRWREAVGQARQRVEVLEDLKARLEEYQEMREAHVRKLQHYRTLERAFSKDGVPALLIEKALPQLQSKANDILDRLSGGSMSVEFITQTAYKDKHRTDLRETLDIQISDGAGVRDYEMFSGGEAFRVDFAIRLALSEVLAQRAGARLQMLVIDEGFGSQDAQGRQRLVEAINSVRQDFAKILVITHLEELKDAFPTRIEVEKTPQGSVVQVF